MGENAPERSGSQLHDSLDELDPHQSHPGGHMAGGQYLVLVVPFALVYLDDLPFGRFAEKLCPAVWGDV